MTRRCSHCGNNGHNSRTCPNRGVKLFGVRITDESIRKSASMGNLSHYAGSSGGASPGDGPEAGGGAAADGYASEDFVKGSNSSCRERKRGVPWTEEEHKFFLLGLLKLGKGDWRGIARSFVVSRTPTQVASHAQKYFIRQTNSNRRKRRSSLFDMVPDEPVDAQSFPMACQEPETQSSNLPPALPALDANCALMASNSNEGEVAAIPKPETLQYPYPVLFSAYVPPFYPFPVPFCLVYGAGVMEKKAHEIVKPTAVHSKASINVDEIAGMSKLSLGESTGETGSSALPPNLLGVSERHSAFHANPPTSGSRLNSSSSPIHAL